MSTAIGSTILDSSLYIPELKPKRKEAALLEMVARAHAAGVVRDAAVLGETLGWRERLGGSGIGKGVAVPHLRSLAVSDSRLVVARSKRGIQWDAPDEGPVHLVLLVLTPAECPEEAHYDMVSRAVAIARLQRNRQKLIEAADFSAVALVLREV